MGVLVEDSALLPTTTTTYTAMAAEQSNKRTVHDYYQFMQQTVTYRSLCTGPQHNLVWSTMPQVDGQDMLDAHVTGTNKKRVEEEAARQLAAKLGLITA